MPEDVSPRDNRDQDHAQRDRFATAQRDGGANDLHAERQTIHRRSRWGLQSAGGTYRVLPTMTFLIACLAERLQSATGVRAWRAFCTPYR
jgi:hypothetical protein